MNRINPFLRGMAIIAVIAVIVLVLQLEATLVVVSALLRIAFILALVFFVYLVWRERRADIAVWPLRARVAFYGAALLIVADIGADWYGGAHGVEILAFIGVIVLCGVAMWRVWRDQHHYV